MKESYFFASLTGEEEAGFYNKQGKRKEKCERREC